MTSSALQRLRSSFTLVVSAFGINIRDRNLAFFQTSFGCLWTADAAYTLGLGVFALRQGGAAEVATVGVLRLLPSALSTPLLAPVIDRIDHDERILAALGAIRTALFVVTGILVATGSAPIWVYIIAVIATMAGQLYRPAHTSLQIVLCRTPRELSASGLVKNFSDSATAFVGPLIAAILITQLSLSSVFIGAAAITLLAAVIPLLIRYEDLPDIGDIAETAPIRSAIRGIKVIASDSAFSMLVGLKFVQSYSRGALNVFIFVIATQLLPTMGEAGAGTLSSASGLGAVGASFFAILLVGARRISGWYGAGIALWGVPVLVIGVTPDVTVAIMMMVLVGVGNALDDVGMWGAITRSVPYRLIGSVNASVWGLITLGIALGSISAPILIDLVGIQTALIITGLIPTVAVGVTWPRLRSLDERLTVHNEQIKALQAAPLLGAFPMPIIEYLANRMREDEFAAGEVIFEQGAIGDLFYVIVEGEVEVVADGSVAATLGPGQFFGEIALLRRIPRTTAIRSVTAVRAFALAAEDFVPTVSGYSASSNSADATINARLEGLRSHTLSI